ncbi:hypothetical protein GCM10010344_64040 [Streptomyces bluensis]|nr:hypothetical protein GCM10010344_64040 [Streptomyces bluensis]
MVSVASEWADAPGRPLEEQLAEIAQEVILRGEAAERRRQDEAEAARQKRIRWEAAMEQARIRYAEAYRVRHLEAQEEAWRHATQLTEYVRAVRTRVEAMPPGQTRTGERPLHRSVRPSEVRGQRDSRRHQRRRNPAAFPSATARRHTPHDASSGRRAV